MSCERQEKSRLFKGKLKKTEAKAGMEGLALTLARLRQENAPSGDKTLYQGEAFESMAIMRFFA